MRNKGSDGVKYREGLFSNGAWKQEGSVHWQNDRTAMGTRTEKTSGPAQRPLDLIDRKGLAALA